MPQVSAHACPTLARKRPTSPVSPRACWKAPNFPITAWTMNWPPNFSTATSIRSTAHLLFLQSDVDEFDAFRSRLPEMTRQGDTRPAQPSSTVSGTPRPAGRYVTNLLQTETFDFTGHDQYALDRENAPRPRDLPEAQQLWRQHVRSSICRKSSRTRSRTTSSAHSRAVTRACGRPWRSSIARQCSKLYLNALAHVYDPHSDYLGREQMETSPSP